MLGLPAPYRTPWQYALQLSMHKFYILVLLFIIVLTQAENTLNQARASVRS